MMEKKKQDWQWMTILLSFILCPLFISSAAAQTYYTRACHDKKLVKEARCWMKSGEWQNGFTKARPHKSVNAVDFYEQYRKNPGQWKALFRWLSETDVLSIPKGKHPIPGTSLVASVEDSQNGELEKRNSESHYHHIDFQWTVSGTEGFGIIDHVSSTPKDEYKPDVIHYHYDREKARFMESSPKEFFIFFPADWHIAKVKTRHEDQQIRVIVIKVDYID